jgi:hypothetical protein
VHEAEQAADAAPDLASLALLGERDANVVGLQLAPGTACVDSDHPLVEVWHAHHDMPPEARDGLSAAEPDRFAAVRAAFARSSTRAEPDAPFESAWVWRDGWSVRVQALAPAGGAFVRALAVGASLGLALDRAQAVGAFDLEAWLVAAVRDGAVLGARPVSASQD